MPRLSIQNNNVPQFVFRYAISMPFLSGEGISDYGLLYAKSITLPKITHESLELSAPTYNYSIMGKVRRDPLTMTVYTYNSLTIPEIMHWVAMHHGEVNDQRPTRQQSYTRAESVTNHYTSVREQSSWYDDYCLPEVSIYLLDEANNPTDKVTLMKVYIDTVDLGELNYEDDAISSATLTLRYERFRTSKIGG